MGACLAQPVCWVIDGGAILTGGARCGVDRTAVPVQFPMIPIVVLILSIACTARGTSIVSTLGALLDDIFNEAASGTGALASDTTAVLTSCSASNETAPADCIDALLGFASNETVVVDPWTLTDSYQKTLTAIFAALSALVITSTSVVLCHALHVRRLFTGSIPAAAAAPCCPTKLRAIAKGSPKAQASLSSPSEASQGSPGCMPTLYPISPQCMAAWPAYVVNTTGVVAYRCILPCSACAALTLSIILVVVAVVLDVRRPPSHKTAPRRPRDGPWPFAPRRLTHTSPSQILIHLVNSACPAWEAWRDDMEAELAALEDLSSVDLSLDALDTTIPNLPLDNATATASAALETIASTAKTTLMLCAELLVANSSFSNLIATVAPDAASASLLTTILDLNVTRYAMAYEETDLNQTIQSGLSDELTVALSDWTPDLPLVVTVFEQLMRPDLPAYLEATPIGKLPLALQQLLNLTVQSLMPCLARCTRWYPPLFSVQEPFTAPRHLFVPRAESKPG